MARGLAAPGALRRRIRGQLIVLPAMDSSNRSSRSSRATCCQEAGVRALLAELLNWGVQVLERPSQKPRFASPSGRSSWPAAGGCGP